MPLFGRKSEPVPPQQVPVQQHHNTLVSRRGTRTSMSSSGNSPPGGHRSSRGGLFSRRRSDSSLSSSDYEHDNRNSTGRTSIGGMFHRNKHEDPSIIAARERVIAAEQAEKDADLALQQARNSVRDAREHVNRLIAEADAEAKAARLKQGQAADLGRRAKPLGRKFY